MKRLLLAAAVLAVLPVPVAGAHARPGCSRLFTPAMDQRAARAVYRGTRKVSHRNLELLGMLERCQVRRPMQATVRTYNHARARDHASRVEAARAPPALSSSDLGDVPGVPYSFASCVAFRESTDGKLSPNIYGMLSYHGESVTDQKREFAEMYAARGTEPWAPYDGC